MRSLVLPLALMVTLLGCDDDSPTAPSPIASGTWSGTAVDSTHGTGTLALVFASGLQGTWTARLPGLPDLRGTFVGAERQGVADLALTPTTALACSGPAPSPLAGSFSLSLTIGSNRLTGPSTFISCNGVVQGTVELTR